MLIKKIFWTGLKIIAGIAVGALAVFGITKVEKRTEKSTEDNNSELGTEEGDKSFRNTTEEPKLEENSGKVEKTISVLNSTASIIQKVGIAVRTIISIFRPEYNSDNVWGYGNNYPPPYYSRPIYGNGGSSSVRQLGPQLVEVGPPNSYYQSTDQYKF